MSERDMPAGSVGWIDLTVDDAERVMDFYRQVTGWRSSPVAMEGYSDFNMLRPEGDDPVAGICHARGGNADLPPRWLIYIVVEDLDASIERCRELGGKLVAGPKGEAGSDRYCIIEDPAGAVAALYQHARAS